MPSSSDKKGCFFMLCAPHQHACITECRGAMLAPGCIAVALLLLAHSSEAQYDVIIVGAGASGLAAGQALLAANKNVLVLEARERAGGRLWTFELNSGKPIDLVGGPQLASSH
jgi:NADPH-dependent 2,4-dienoyl-CoA reductase/sulfur reductase-like enzyme